MIVTTTGYSGGAMGGCGRGEDEGGHTEWPRRPDVFKSARDEIRASMT